MLLVDSRHRNRGKLNSRISVRTNLSEKCGVNLKSDVQTSPVLLGCGSVLKCNSNSHVFINWRRPFPVFYFSFWTVEWTKGPMIKVSPWEGSYYLCIDLNPYLSIFSKKWWRDFFFFFFFNPEGSSRNKWAGQLTGNQTLSTNQFLGQARNCVCEIQRLRMWDPEIQKEVWSLGWPALQ